MRENVRAFYYYPWQRKLFVVFNYLFLTCAALICVLPILNILAISLSSSAAAGSGEVRFWPVDFTWKSYNFVTAKPEFMQSFLGVRAARSGGGACEHGAHHSGGVSAFQNQASVSRPAVLRVVFLYHHAVQRRVDSILYDHLQGRFGGQLLGTDSARSGAGLQRDYSAQFLPQPAGGN